MKRGFTLVELAIVLVIIGLLIGGILVAQSMIETARLNATIQRIGQFDAAVANFRNKYKQWPGDDTYFQPISALANDGKILGEWGAPYRHTMDMGNFWNHLSQSEVLDRQYAASYNGVTTAIIPDVNYPSVPINKRATFTGMTQYDGTAFSAFQPVYWIAELPLDNIRDDQGGTGYALTTAQAKAFDTKLDDGLSRSGDVVAAGRGGGASYPPAFWICDYWVGQYLLDQTGKKCNIMIKMLRDAGGSV